MSQPNLTHPLALEEKRNIRPVCNCRKIEYSAGIMIVRGTLQRPSADETRRMRRQAIAWAVATATNRQTIYLDTETTGLDGSAEIVEVAAVDYQGRTLLDTLVQPQGAIPRDAEAIHGISNAMVARAPCWPQVYAELSLMLLSGAVVVYNADFDFRMVNQMNHRHGIPACLDGWQCAMNRYSGFAGAWHERYGNYRWHKLDQAVAAFGHPPGRHRALSDATACRLVVLGIAES